jgi:hypothetical protein
MYKVYVFLWALLSWVHLTEAQIRGNQTNNNGNRFANFCAQTGLTLADGTQNRNGACSETIQGAIPSVNRMTSTIIINPMNGAPRSLKTLLSG